MMMMGRGAAASIHAPPWMLDDAADGLPYSIPLSGICGGGDWLGDAALTALQRYLPSNESAYADSDDGDLEAPVDAYACDEFRIYEFKVRRCARGRSHDWTECPYAHLGEKARRRDPRKFHYSGTACPDFRKGNCKRGDACEFAHGVFECWLHPTRYRTQPCKDGTSCRRRVCFFAHTPEQLRVLPQQHSPRSSSSVALESYDGSPMRRLALEDYFPKNLVASPTDQSPVESPPVSPSGEALRRASWPVAGSTMNDVVASLRQLQLSKVKPAWGVFGSPRAGICSQPSTPTRLGGSRGWVEEEPVERVESGRALRAKMFERLSRESVMEKKPEAAASASPDVDWISELVK